MYSTEVRGLCSWLPLAILGMVRRDLQPAPEMATGLPSPAGNSVPSEAGENIMAYKSKLSLAKEHFPACFHSPVIQGGLLPDSL